MGGAQAAACMSCLTGFLLLLTEAFPRVCQATGQLLLSAFDTCETGPITCLQSFEYQVHCCCRWSKMSLSGFLSPLRFPRSSKICCLGCLPR